MSGESSTRQASGLEFSARSAGRAEVRGRLVFATARHAREVGLAALRDATDALVIDCEAVDQTDSAGLAVLLDWLAEARRAGRRLRFENLPENLLRLARISAVDGLLQQGV